MSMSFKGEQYLSDLLIASSELFSIRRVWTYIDKNEAVGKKLNAGVKKKGALKVP